MEIEKFHGFHATELPQSVVKDNYRQLIELSVIFSTRDDEKIIKCSPSGAIKQDGIVRAIYS